MKIKLDYRRLAFVIAGLIIAASILFPYLGIMFTSPQYPNRSPKMFLYVYGLKGDFADWEILGRYVGLNLYPVLPEFDGYIIVLVLAVLALLCIAAALFGPRWRKYVPIVLIAVGAILLGWAQFRLYQQGHDLDPTAPLRFTVKPFTPPLIGVTKVSRIRIYHFPHVGGILFFISVSLASVAGWVKTKKKRTG